LIEKHTKLLLNDYCTKYKSKHWERYNYRNDLYKDLNLFNFRNNSLSSGLDDQNDKLIINKLYLRLQKKIPLKFINKNLTNKNIGNLKNYILLKKKKHTKIIDYGQLFFIYWLFFLKRKVKKIKYICEIGAGYGGFSEKIIRNYSNLKYLIIDLPEANFLSSYFLTKNFPNKKILLAYKKKRKFIYKSDFNKYDIIIIPPWYIARNIKFDLFINTRSMMEMDKNIIFEYFEFIQKNISEKGYFLNINRYFKNSVQNPLKLTDYPYDNNWNVLMSQPSWQQKHIRILLTQRNNNPKNSISTELKKLSKITNNYFFKEKKNKKSLCKEIYFSLKRGVYLVYKYFKNKINY
jgi:putative sugar O-methyltransferase